MTVLDASAVLAFLGGEPGRTAVGKALGDGNCAISSVNWSEVCQKQRQHELPQAALTALGELVDIVPVSRTHAEDAALLWLQRRELSIADRLCMALAIGRQEPALTCDRAWASIDVADLRVVLVR